MLRLSISTETEDSLSEGATGHVWLRQSQVVHVWDRLMTISSSFVFAAQLWLRGGPGAGCDPAEDLCAGRPAPA